ncbi:MAG: ribonuclease E/G [Phycisphaerales bacterium JB059]
MNADQTLDTPAQPETQPESQSESHPDSTPEQTPAADAPPATKKKRSTRKKTSRKKKTATKRAESGETDEPAAPEVPPADEQAEGEAGDETEGKDDQSEPKTAKKKSRSRRKKKTTSSASERDAPGAKPAGKTTDTRMLINYDPGGECRVAIVEDGRLEEFFSEPTTQVSRVNNIYVGKVTNVEPAIQAAFVDFGVEENGFLHVSDLHPQYFPGENSDTTERVGKKIPRRSRPPIQDCLKRGQEVVVQVLKEGVGTKGPTLTSYLSIPGRYIVMMPDMDRVGVSRKEEDDDKRRAAKEILNSLELPEGFGFILRTAGMGRTKTELKRDLAYLQRLWKDMEKRRKAGRRPRLLYSESDLLVRSIRDLLTSDVSSVTIDHEPAVRRAASFLKIVAPRTQAKLIHYTGKAPIFHAFDIQDQIETIHARDVPLPSGGRLVIDETEALVAIDVNSGKSRSARDAETNAYRTNLEATDEICRQLRLRDLGGLVVCDLIDMRFASHRKEIENRFKDRFKNDRARTTVLPISQFGILELTRQRMRGSQESLHFSTCPTCRGRGLLQRPESVAARALRQLADVLDRDKVARVELVVSPRVAGALLSQSRAAMTRLEISSGKTLDVRFSYTLPPDRVAIYAYDDSGA